MGELPTVEVADLDAALAFAEQHLPAPSHQQSVGDVRGFCICDDGGAVPVSWRQHKG